jgi:hypothetical protein
MIDLTGVCDSELALHLEGCAVKVHLVGRPSVPVRAPVLTDTGAHGRMTDKTNS